ncbi:MAG: myo-inosose-2 dehydratase [Arenicellales bacterium WSBS_2016_MAG_OTU3]
MTVNTKSRVRLAVAPIAWSNDDMPALGGDTPLEVCLAESRAAGFCGTEMGGKFPRDAKTLAPLLQQHGLTLASGWFSGLLYGNQSVDEEMRRMREQLTCFAELGTDVLFYADTTSSVQGQMDTPLSKRPRLPKDAFAAYGKKLTALAERMKADYGICMAYHHHMGTLIESEGEVDLLMANSGEAVGLLVDSGHIAFAGGDPTRLFVNHARRIRYVHCKDLRSEPLAAARREDWPFMRAVLEGAFTVPGDGCLDFQSFLNAAAAAGYRGWVVVEAEQDPAKANPLRYSRMGGEHIRECCARAGIAVSEDNPNEAIQ